MMTASYIHATSQISALTVQAVITAWLPRVYPIPTNVY
jgi:hypothetical protein